MPEPGWTQNESCIIHCLFRTVSKTQYSGDGQYFSSGAFLKAVLMVISITEDKPIVFVPIMKTRWHSTRSIVYAR